MRRRLFIPVVMLVVLLFGVSAHASLVDMGDGTIYDTDTQLSWLQDANYAMTSGYDADGRMTLDQAVAWAASLNVGGLTGWRLPNADPVCGFNYNCTNSEMGHLYYTSLGNAAGGPLHNTGPFTNVQANVYWSGTVYAPDPSYAWYFIFGIGYQGHNFRSGNFWAWAVRPGARAVPPATPVGYNPTWLMITLFSLMGVGGLLLREKTTQQ